MLAMPATIKISLKQGKNSETCEGLSRIHEYH